MLADLSIWHILILAGVVMLVFGAKRIPEIGASLGKGIQEFKRGLRDVSADEPPSEPPPKTGGPKRLSE
jgi:sec-independent protein translocase protein TatA